MIYLWRTPASAKNKEIGCYDEENSPDRFMLIQGQVLSAEEFSPAPLVDFIIPKNRVLTFDCLVNNASTPLVNQRVRTIFEEVAPKEVQFFPAKIRCTDGLLENTYYYLNTTHLVQCIDHERSIYSKMINADAILSFKKLVYREDGLHGLNVARDKEYKPHVLVSEKIKAIFTKEKIKGVLLLDPEDY